MIRCLSDWQIDKMTKNNKFVKKKKREKVCEMEIEFFQIRLREVENE